MLCLPPTVFETKITRASLRHLTGAAITNLRIEGSLKEIHPVSWLVERENVMSTQYYNNTQYRPPF